MQELKVTSETKKEIFKKYGGSETNTGSVESQVAMLTARINHISAHLKENHKDNSSLRGLMNLVGQRKKLLNYLSKKDIEKYRTLIADLGLRK